LVELEFAGEDLLCGVSVRAVLVRRSCRRRSRIILAHLFFVLAASSSSAYGEVGAFCTGVRGWQLVVFQVMLLLPFFCSDAGLSMGVVVAGRPDLALFSLGGGGCQS
jgi:hypothetical protein